VVENDENWRPWVPRVLAPLAFFAAATTLVVVVHRSLTADTAATPSPATGAPTGATGTKGAEGTGTTEPTTTQGGRQARRFYRVREGDFLETIAQRFDTTVDDLLQLNPNVDPNNLQPGQRLRVR
jgi:LysM repeat protein